MIADILKDKSINTFGDLSKKLIKTYKSEITVENNFLYQKLNICLDENYFSALIVKLLAMSYDRTLDIDNSLSDVNGVRIYYNNHEDESEEEDSLTESIMICDNVITIISSKVNKVLCVYPVTGYVDLKEINNLLTSKIKSYLLINHCTIFN